MLALLAVNWRLLVLRAAIAMSFGMLVLLWPGLTLRVLAVFFGCYALLEGVVALITAFRAPRGFPEVRGLLFGGGLVRIGAGVIALAYPDISAIALLVLIAVWAILNGVIEIGAAVALRKEMSGAWPLPVAGAISVLLGVLLALQLNQGALALVWLIGLYALCFGVMLLALALRLQELAPEIARA
jgi:uncharacterized membrane protein HdeD (DUF308 family)